MAPLVRYHAVITVPHVTNVGVDNNGRVLICGRTHLVLSIILLADCGGGLYRLKDGVTIDRNKKKVGLGRVSEGQKSRHREHYTGG